MSDYAKKKKDMKFQSQDALKTVQSVIDDADKALKDKSRRMKDSPIGEALAGAVGVGLGAIAEGGLVKTPLTIQHRNHTRLYTA